MADIAGYPAGPGTPRIGMATSMATPGRPPSRGRPGSRGGLTTPKTPSADKLSPMPDYMRPVVKSAVRKWKKLHEDHMMHELYNKQCVKKEQNQEIREKAKNIMRKIPMELLAGQWLKKHAETAEMRAFLVDKVLPTLIMGIEKLLTEVDNKGLAMTELPDPNFNPLNFLAQYLMRNNPRYSNFSEASPYIRKIRSVGEELKQQLFDIDENRLARIKAEAKKKREDREEVERMKDMEKTRRQMSIRKQFQEWNINIDGKVELALIQNALLSFVEVMEHFPEDLKRRASFSQDLDPTDDTGRSLINREFQAYIAKYVDEMPSEVFDAFINHMGQCAKTFRLGAEREQRRTVLTQLFTSCDHTIIGLLDRHRILNLYEMFYNKAKTPDKNKMRNPKKWPVIEMREMADFLSDDEEDTSLGQDPTFIDNNVDVTEQTKAADKKITGSPRTEEEKSDPTDTNDQRTTESKGETKQDDSESEHQEKGTEKGDVKEQVKDEGQEEKEQTGKEAEDKEKAQEEKDETKEVADQKKEEVPETVDSDKKQEPEVVDSAKKEVRVEVVTEKSGDSLTGSKEKSTPLASGSGEKPPLTQQSKVSFADGIVFERERSLLMSQGTRSQSQASQFDEDNLTVSQFVHVTETFLGDDPGMDSFGKLVRFVKEGYLETEDEKMERLMKARREANIIKRRMLLNSVFEMWDNDGSGFLDLDEVETVMKKYKDGTEQEAIEIAKAYFKKKSKYQDHRLTKREFREFVYKAVDNMEGGEDTMDLFTDFIMSCVERSYQERVRGEARKKWLQQIVQSGEMSGAKMEPVYRTLFQTLFKDAESHGNGKRVSAYISLLERNFVTPSRGVTLLKYEAATNDDTPLVVGKMLFRDQKGISFSAVDSGKPIHVPRVNTHGNIHFWNPDHLKDEKDGSFIVVPLKDRRKRVFGLLGIDTLNDPHSRSIFITHEIQFFQGVAKAFSIAYHHVDIRQKTMRISESAIAWVHRRSPHVHEINMYMVEPDGKGEDYVLRKMMHTDHKGHAHMISVPPTLERKDNLFRDYLFKCVDTSESVSADAYGQRHLGIPLRDYEGRAIAVVDISIGEMKVLPKVENKEMMRMLKLLQMAYDEIARESREGEKTVLLEAEHDSDNRVEILFDRLMLMELRDNVSKLDSQAYAELKSYKEPPLVVLHIIQAVLGVFYPEKAIEGEFNDWNNCKKYVNTQLNHKILAFDPTKADDIIPVELINQYLADVPHGAVSKHGSIPAQHLYNWVFVCVSLIEHTRKMAEAKEQEINNDGEEKQTEEESEDQQQKEQPTEGIEQTETKSEKSV